MIDSAFEWLSFVTGVMVLIGLAVLFVITLTDR